MYVVGVKKLVLGIVLVNLTLLTGCQTECQTGSSAHIRAIWVTRYEYETADDVVRIMDNCKRAGFNTVLFQVRGNGTAFYRSDIEPWAEELGGKDPGFDPLALALEEAHDRGLKLQAWVNVMPGWRGPDEPSDPNQLYHKHPDWFWYDADGKRQPMNHQVGDSKRAWYVSINPCLPEVRAYLVAVFREILQNYEVDGLHLDYIRFPSEPVVPGEKIPDYPRDPRTVALFEQWTGVTPSQDPQTWSRWRTERVTQLVSDIHAMLRRTRPGAVLSAAVGTNRKRSLTYHRDAKTWVKQGIIDVVFPMNYKPDLETFRPGLAMWAPHGGDVPVVPGLWFDRRLSTEAGIDVTRQQIEAAVEATGNFCLFAYHLLFESPRDDKLPLARRSALATQRTLRRRMLLPLLRGEARTR